MKFKNLPATAVSRIGDFLDPKSKISYLKAIGTFYAPPEPRESPWFHCYFCVMSLWYHEMPMGQLTNEDSEDFCFTLRSEFDHSVIKRGHDSKIYKSFHFRRRHYSSREDEPELTKLFSYFGIENYLGF